jgi:hypothetical protein
MTKRKKYEGGGDLKSILGSSSMAANSLVGLLGEGTKTNEQKGQAIGQTVGALTAAIPGIGPMLSQVLTPLLGTLGGAIGAPEDMQNQMNNNYQGTKENVTTFAFGGALENASSDFAQYKGNTHEQGGITINQNGMPADSNIEVEDEESVVSFKSLNGKDLRFVFSKRLKL